MCSNTVPDLGLGSVHAPSNAKLPCVSWLKSVLWHFSGIHNSAKAQCEAEPCGLGLGWGCAVTPACDTELRSGLYLLLPKLWRFSAVNLET